MSRTFRKNEQGRRPEDTRRNKRREKANSHYDNPYAERQEHHRQKRYDSNVSYNEDDLDTE